MSVKKTLLFIIISLVCLQCLQAQTEQQKREKRANLVLKSWITPAGGKTRYLDHVTKYDSKGYKTEETEYAGYGQKYRITYQYNEKGQCIKEVEYDSRNKPVRIRKMEYYADGSKKKQYNYLPSGKLESYKVYEYIFKAKK